MKSAELTYVVTENLFSPIYQFQAWSADIFFKTSMTTSSANILVAMDITVI